MKKEFYIFAREENTRYIVKGLGQGYPREFASLFEAARHVRTQPGCDAGLVVIHDEEGKAVNRIPFPANS